MKENRASAIKIATNFLVEMDKPVLNFIWKYKEPRQSKQY